MAILLVEADLAALLKYEEGMRAFGPARFQQIVAWTLNQVGNKLRTQVARSLVTQTGLKYGEVRDQMNTIPASAASLAYEVIGSGRYFGVGHFSARAQGQNPRGVNLKTLWGPVNTGGVSASPWGRAQLFRGAFMVGGRVFVRRGPARYPIKFLYGPSVPREMERDAIPQDFIAAAEHELPGAIDRKLNQMLPI